MALKKNLPLLLLCCITATAVQAQYAKQVTLNIDDPAPPLYVREWLKGSPVPKYQKGQVYVVEFWATWCHPCRTYMPHLSALARQYRDKVTFIGIDIYEMKTTPFAKVKAFVDSMGERMDYTVAAQESYRMESGWFDAADASGIPKTFVIDATGRLAWIGQPGELDTVLRKVLDGAWDNKAVRAQRNADRELEALSREAHYELAGYGGKPEGLLKKIDSLVSKEPKLQFTPSFVGSTFNALLETDPHKAYEFGRRALVTPSYEEPDYYMIYANIRDYTGSKSLPAEIYLLGAEAYQLQIDHGGLTLDYANLYHRMAEFYAKAGDKAKAVEAAQQAIEAMKKATEPSRVNLALLETQLQQYTNE